MNEKNKQILEAGLRGEEVSLKGVIVQGDRDERLNMDSVILSTDVELDLVIERDVKGDELFDHLRKLVRVNGFLGEDKNGRRTIRIANYEILD